LAQRSTGKLRVLGVTTLQRWETAKDIPSIAETLPGFEAVTSMFIVAPPRTPSAAVERLASGFRTALSDPEIKRTFLEMGANVEFLGPDALGKQISAELKSWPELLRSIGIRPGSS
jgi:tripartite-type tricarboxylate transporter receptor subunit TctC